MPDFTQVQRQRLAARNRAMPDGGFPIRNVSDLKNAIRAYGRAKNKPAVKKWIKERARQLGREDLLPENWRISSETLVHYGIKGQKWGIRRFQNKDGSLTAKGKARYAKIEKEGGRIIRSGEALQRISSENERRFNRDYTWLSHTPGDNDFYLSAMTRKHYEEGKRFIYKNKFTNVKDLVIPSNKKQVDTFIDIYKKSPVRVAEDLSNGIAYKVSAGRSAVQRKAIKDLYLNKLITSDENRMRDVIYPTFISLYGSTSLTKVYNKKLLKEGYNTIVDDSDKLVNNSLYGGKVRPDDPLIVLNPKKNLRQTGYEYVTYNKDFKDAEKRLYDRSKNNPKKPSEYMKKLHED